MIPAPLRKMARKILGRPDPAPPKTAAEHRAEVLAGELALPVGFHGDKYVLELADFFLGDAEAFVETGTQGGATARYVGEKFPRARVLSCEADETAWRAASERCKDLPGIDIRHEPSPDFLYRLLEREPDLVKRKTVFWLDAHGFGFRWPLREEIAFVTERFESAVIMIDDFKVPGRPEFGFDAYDGQECSLEYLAGSPNPARSYRVILPAYSDRTSPYHGLRGVGTFTYGSAVRALPPALAAKFSDDPYRPRSR